MADDKTIYISDIFFSTVVAHPVQKIVATFHGIFHGTHFDQRTETEDNGLFIDLDVFNCCRIELYKVTIKNTKHYGKH